MASRSDSAGASRLRSRRSIAHVPRSKLLSGIDKENTTTDIAAAQSLVGRGKLGGQDKKSRSKSLGPGGLDALQDSNGNRRKSSAAFPLKSILKPTVPVSPVRNIPTFEETRRKTPARGPKQHETGIERNQKAQEGLLIDFDTPAQQLPTRNDDTTNPFDTFNASSIRDEMAAAREQEEKERRERERKAALEQREARRKSMANRRVSFAPEATLHTWNVVEIPDDSTSSSAANSTRRASSLTNPAPEEPAQPSKQNEPPSSPDIDAESDIAFSPVQYPDLQRLTNHPAAGGYDGMVSSQEMSSSPMSGSDAGEDTGLQSLPGDGDDDDDSSSASGFDGESTAMSMDDLSVHSAMTTQSDETGNSTNRLNDALRAAGTRGVDYDDHEEMSMEIADQEITGAFQPWIKKGQRQSFDWEDISARHDQENIDPSKPINPGVSDVTSANGDEDLSMDVTNAIGRIIPNRRQSSIRRKSTGEETIYDEQTMELTNMIGGIAQPDSPAKSTGADSNADEDEEMTMEFTSVVGGLLKKPTEIQNVDGSSPGQSSAPAIERNFSEWNEDDDPEGMDMEITGAVGGILPSTREEPGREDGNDDGQDGSMDVTPVGKILLPRDESTGKAKAKRVMELEADSVQLGSSPFQENARASPAKSLAGFHVATVASESGSPSLASVRSRRTRQSLNRRASTTPTSTTPQKSPTKHTTTPPKQFTPQVDRPLTPGKTPPSKNISFRSASLKKLFDPEIQASASQRKSPGRKSLFGHNAAGESTPLFVLRPQEKRRSSGLGIDKEGLGSPRVAAMLDKRRSIGEEAGEFVPQKHRQQGVRFEDPVKLQEEVDREREEEENREDGHIPPLQPSDRDPTANLRDMISSLTPKKNKLRGRKSLHVGAARGLLGKRPVELDQDDEEAESTPKRLRGRGDVSPVKNIRLPPPPSKDETVGRALRSPVRKQFGTSPAKGSTTPTQEPQSTLVTIDPSALGENKVEEQQSSMEESGSDFDPIQLQDFLNMTNIHFMELTTTKRRHTTAPDSASKRAARLSTESEARSSTFNFEECAAAGFCTVPMLELYQHSCRELKSYISEGRQIIRSIEAETYADNPPLFREYMTAAPDIRLLMDNQFRNVKTHTRLLSKATWYEWRMKLLEGLKDGLDRHVEEMKADGELLSNHEEILNGSVPALVEKHSSLEKEAATLQRLAEEMENCDQDELRGAREKLVTIEEEIEAKKKLLQELQDEVQNKTATIETGVELKAEFMAQIQEAERVKEECRGWSAKEISELKDSVHKIEQQTGWSIFSASSGSSAGPLVAMSYRNQLHLTFHPGSFLIDNGTTKSTSSEKANTAIELKYHPENGTKPIQQTPPLSPVAMLVLKSLQSYLLTINQSTTAPKQLLRFISKAWDLTLSLEEEARMLGFHGVTRLRLLDDSEATPSLKARCTLLGTMPPAPTRKPNSTPSKKIWNTGKSRIDVDFSIQTRILHKKDAGEIGVMDIQTNVIASKVYGFGTDNDTGPSENEMQSILSNELKGTNKSGLKLGNGVWSKAVQMLSGKVF